MGEGEKCKRRGWGDRGWRGGAIEGAMIGRLMLFYNSGAGDRKWGGRGLKGLEEDWNEDWKAGDGEGEPGRGARVGWLMLFNDT